MNVNGLEQLNCVKYCNNARSILVKSKQLNASLLIILQMSSQKVYIFIEFGSHGVYVPMH